MFRRLPTFLTCSVPVPVGRAFFERDKMIRFFTVSAALAGVFLSSSLALADPVSVGDLTVSKPWARATPPKAPAAGGFVVITNDGDEADRLLAVAAPHAGRSEIHEMKIEDDVMVMRPLADGLEIPAHETVVLEPGGYHLMFMSLNAPQVEGEDVPVTLTFEKAGAVDVVLDVYPIGSPGPDGKAESMDHGAMNHEGHDMGGMKDEQP